MQIHALEFNTEINFILQKNGDTVEITSHVCSYTEEIISSMTLLSQKTLIPFIFMDMDEDTRRILDLWSSGWEVSISAVINSQHYSFIPEDIKTVTLPSGKKYLIIFDVDNVDKNDRRGAYRFPVDVPGLLVYWRALEPIHVTVKDLSVTGVGILMDKDRECAVRDKICLSFEADGTLQSVHGQIVRIADYDKDHYLIGCTIKSEELK